MCGICGYISKNKISDDVLVTMRDTMIYRGPDDAGLYQTTDGDWYIGLAHRRLSIFDLSGQGHQPMLSNDLGIAIVYNGEVYNFLELKEELEESGYNFKSTCDTEVILYAYDKWGENCFSKLNGMFAIAIWDNRKRQLILARDRLGVKPLYYYLSPSNDEIVFASELKPIMQSPRFERELNLPMLGNYFCNKYIPAPDTIFNNTYKMLPGSYAVYTDGNIRISMYWDIMSAKNQASSELITDFEQAKKELNDSLTKAVVSRMVADVPVGLFLSSGIDSTLVTAIAQKHSSKPVKTFTIGFYDKERNEASGAKRIAKYLETDHRELYIGEADVLKLLESIPDYYDEPFSDSSQLPTMLVSKLAKESVTVALSGDGGDELFCGYKIYDLVRIAQIVDPIGNMLYHIPGIQTIKRMLSPEIRAFINNRNENSKTQLFADVFKEKAKCLLLNGDFDPKFHYEDNLTKYDFQERRMLLDMMTYLPDEVMAKTDRASMKYSLEVRSPLLDVNVVEKSFRIPHQYKYYQGSKKHILKELTYEYLPREFLTTRKMGFGVPLRKWLIGPLKEEIEYYSDYTFIHKQGLFNHTEICKLISEVNNQKSIIYSSMLWSYYIFQRWWERYM